MVVADLHLQQMFPKMVDEGVVPPMYQMKVSRPKHSFGTFQQSLALNEVPQFVCPDEETNPTFLAEFAPRDEEECERYFFDLSRSRA